MYYQGGSRLSGKTGVKAAGATSKRVESTKPLQMYHFATHRDPLEIYVDSESIMLKKYTPACILCGKTDNLVEYMGKKICRKCIKDLS